MIPEPQVETVTVESFDEWDAVVSAYKALGWVLAASTYGDQGTRLTFVPKPEGEPT